MMNWCNIEEVKLIFNRKIIKYPTNIVNILNLWDKYVWERQSFLREV